MQLCNLVSPGSAVIVGLLQRRTFAMLPVVSPLRVLQTSRLQHNLSLLTQTIMSNAIACKILDSKQAMHISIIHKMNPRTSSRGVQKTRRFSLKSSSQVWLVRGCPSAKRSADHRSDGILERLALFQAGTAAADR